MPRSNALEQSPPTPILHLIPQSSDSLALVQQGKENGVEAAGEEWRSQSWSSLDLGLHVSRSEREEKI